MNEKEPTTEEMILAIEKWARGGVWPEPELIEAIIRLIKASREEK